MSNMEISVDSIVAEIIADNKKLAFENSVLRAAIQEVKTKADELSAQINNPSGE